jgi:aspartyl-tRNA(Asn)/glutamyl-tRNA(Gln) amidotransferase subunit C
MSLTPAEITKVATLARLRLTPEETVRHAETISAVLEYMNILNEVDTTHVEPTFQVTGLSEVLRDDVTAPSPLGEKLIGQFPQVEQNSLVVPAVFE